MESELEASTSLVGCQTPPFSGRVAISLGAVLNGKLRPVLEEASPGASSDSAGNVDKAAWRRAVLAMADSMEGRSADEAVLAMSVHLQDSDQLIRRWATDVIDEVKSRALALSALASPHSRTSSPSRSETTNAGVSFLDTESRLVLEEILTSLRAERHERAALTAAVDALSRRVDGANLGSMEDISGVQATGIDVNISSSSSTSVIQSQVKALSCATQTLMAKVDALAASRPQSPTTPQDTDGATQPSSMTKDVSMLLETSGDKVCFADTDVKEARILLESLQKEKDMVSAMAHGLRQEKAEVANMARWLQIVRQDAIAETKALEKQRTAMVEAAADLRSARDAATNAVLELQREHMLADRAAKSLQEHLSVLNAAGSAAAAMAAAKAAAIACEGSNSVDSDTNTRSSRRSASTDRVEASAGFARSGSQARLPGGSPAQNDRNSAKVSPRRRASPEGFRTVERSGSGNLPVPVAIQRTVSAKPCNSSSQDNAANRRPGIGGKGSRVVPVAQKSGASTIR